MKMKKIGKLGKDGVYCVGRRVVVHSGEHLDESPNCKLHYYIATKRTLQRFLDGSARKFKKHDITYPSKKKIQIGCTTIPLTLVRKALKALS